MFRGLLRNGPLVTLWYVDWSQHKFLSQQDLNNWVDNLYFNLLYTSLSPQDRSNTPLHVAANAGQALQVELLIVHGADPTKPDINGKTPVDYAL